MSTRIFIGADLVPTQSNFVDFKEGNVTKLIGKELIDLLKTADFSIFNLEVPLCDMENPIEKCGPNLIAPRNCILGLKKIAPYYLSLANNHILDQGENGLIETMRLLDESNIRYSGAGRNIEEAKKSFVKEIQGIKIGIYSCAEHEFSIATMNTAGANPFDPLESFDHILTLKKKCDFVIVLYHGGKEHYRYPSPQLQKVCRKFIDKGANLVICQHSHCIGSKENWGNGCIVYGQGNFLFDDSESEYWKTSLLLEVDLNKENNIIKSNIIYHPLVKEKEKVRLAKTDIKKNILSEFELRSAEILIPQKVEELYQEFADKMYDSYLIGFTGKRNKFFFRVINKILKYHYLGWYLRKNYKTSDLYSIQNHIECEAHRELFLKGLKSNTSKRNDKFENK